MMMELLCDLIQDFGEVAEQVGCGVGLLDDLIYGEKEESKKKLTPDEEFELKMKNLPNYLKDMEPMYRFSRELDRKYGIGEFMNRKE